MLFKAAFLAVLFATTTAATNRISTDRLNDPMIKEVECLAENIYREAPEESYEGQLAVATVTMNRLRNKEFPKTVCGVVYQPGQFSWTYIKKLSPHNEMLYEKARQIAEDVLYNGKRLLSIRNALYFHNTTVTPKWIVGMHVVQQIGNHIFYVTGT